MKASTSLRLPADETKVVHISNTLRAKGYLLKILLQRYIFGVRTDEVNFGLTNCEEHSSSFLNICPPHNIESTNQVVLDVTFLQRAEETTTLQACILKLLSEGQGATAKALRRTSTPTEGPLSIPQRLQRRLKLIQEEKPPLM